MTKHYWFYERREGDPDPVPLSLHAVMTPSPQTLSPEDPVREALRLMQEKEIRHIPVVEGKKIVGIVSETDILKQVLHGKHLTPAEQYHASLDMMHPVGDIMSTSIITLPSDAPVADAISLFQTMKIRSVLVVNKKIQLEGIVTETDLLGLLSHMVGT